jgi:PhoH-like ATPase
MPPRKKAVEFQEKPKPDFVRYDRPKPITENHRKYHNLLKDPQKRIVAVDGYSGSGKSISAMYYACQAVLNNDIRGIYLVRPNEGVGKDIGFLPGTELEKLTPKLRQLLLYAESFLNTDIKTLIDNKTIIVQSLYNLQGMDLTGHWLIIDETQLLDAKSMYCICTRGAERIILTGDCSPAQCFTKGIKKGKDGLSFLMETMGHLPIVGVANMNSEDDIVRQDYMKLVIVCMTEALEIWDN